MWPLKRALLLAAGAPGKRLLGTAANHEKLTVVRGGAESQVPLRWLAPGSCVPLIGGRRGREQATMAGRGARESSGGPSPRIAAADEREVIQASQWGTTVTAALNRPKALNALNNEMVVQLRAAYEKWENDRAVHAIILKGNGRAFCAGGDVRAMYHMGKSGDLEAGKLFFRHEYELNYILATLKKPHIALLDGLVMGGGNGISMHGAFRVATENSSFAMPETGIGLHPDVGASFFLSRLYGSLGEFLGLTGARLDGAEMLSCGLATHYVPSDMLERLEERLAFLGTASTDAISVAILEHEEHVEPMLDSALHKMERINECFDHDNVEDIVEHLEAAKSSGDEWCSGPLAAIAKASPTSLKVTLRSIREARRKTLAECLKQEYRLTVRCLESTTSHDFYEGVGAVLVHKHNNPKWKPARLKDVTVDVVNEHFSPLPSADDELKLPVQQREPQQLHLQSRL